MNQTLLDQLLDQFLAQAFDIHGAARAKKFQTLFELRWTGDTNATIGGFAFFAEYFRAANGTVVRHDELSFSAGAFLFEHLHNVRDNIAGALDDDGVADADIFAFDLVHVMQRSAFDHHAADRHGLQARHRRQRARSTDVGLNVENARRRLARLKLVGDRPPGRASDLSQALLQRRAVDLYHQPIDLVGQFVTTSFYLVAVLKNFAQAPAHAPERHGL